MSVPIALDGETPEQYAYHGLLDPDVPSVDIVRGLHDHFAMDWPESIGIVHEALENLEEEIRGR